MKKNKKILFSVIIFLFFFAVSIGIYFTGFAQGTVPDHLKLKASNEKILKHQIVQDIRCDEKDCKDYGEIVKYAYVSDREAALQTLGEVLSDSTLQKNNISLEKKSIREASRDYNFQNFDLGNGKEASVFYSGIPFVKKNSTGKWFYTEVATTTPEAFESQVAVSPLMRFINIALASTTESTFYPSAGANSPVDGYVAKSDSDWSVARGASSGSDASVSETNNDFAQSRKISIGYRITKGFFLFDTSSIPDTDNITSATFSLYGLGISNAQSTYVQLCKSNPASDDDLVLDDFDQVDNTNLSKINLSEISTGAYNDFEISDLSVISKTGNTNLGMRTGLDIENIAPTNNGDYNGFDGYYSDNGSNKPKLVVVYDSPDKNYKNFDQNSFSTTLQNDYNIQPELAANKIYAVEGLLFATAENATPDLKIAFTTPSGATKDISYVAHDSNATYNSIYRGILESSGVPSQEISLTSDDKEIIQISGTIKTGATAGNLQLQWAQNTASAYPTIVNKGSYIIITEIPQT